MQTITVGARYQVVIPLQIRKQVTGVEAGAKAHIFVLDPETIVISTPHKKWSDDNYGSLKSDLPQNSTQVINDLREEWSI